MTVRAVTIMSATHHFIDGSVSLSLSQDLLMRYITDKRQMYSCRTDDDFVTVLDSLFDEG